MEITEVKVFPISEEKLKAFVSVVFDHCFMVNDIKIIQGRDGLFISMPSRKKKNGEFKDVAHPLNNGTRRMIEGLVLTEYERVLTERGEALPAPPRVPVGLTPGPDVVESGVAASGDEEAPAAPATAEAPKTVIPVSAPPESTPVEVAASAPQEGEGGEGEEGKTPNRSLEEIQEMHLRDSFWSTP